MKKWNVGWGPVSKCNMNCQFCYSKMRRKDGVDLQYSDWINFISDNHQRINSINYGTGENTLDKNWFKLISFIRNNYPHIRQSLTTNGYLAEATLNQDCLSAFVQGIDEVDVSLDYCDERLHTEFRGQPKAYSWAINTLELCQKYNKSATIVFLGSDSNLKQHNIDGLFKIAQEHGAILRMNMYRPTEGINEFTKKFIVSYDTFVNALTYISEKYSIIALNDALFSSFLTNQTVQDPSGARAIRILSDGSITPSTYLIDKKFVVANIKEKNVLERLEYNDSFKKIVKKVIPKECLGCVYQDSCAGGVYDRRILWYGTLNKKDPYCPSIFVERNKKPLNIANVKFKSVHDGYLPTIFFSPGRNSL